MTIVETSERSGRVWFRRQRHALGDQCARLREVLLRWLSFPAVALDSSGRQRTELDLHTSEERLHFCARSAGMSAWELDLETGEAWTSNILAISGPSEKRTVRNFSEWLELLHPDDRPNVQRALREAIHGGFETYTDFRTIWQDGSIHWFRARGQSRGEKRVFGMTWDITDLKAAESAWRIAKESAESANRAKSEFLANMSHEIRTPLAVITGFAALLDDRSIPPEERTQFIQTIVRNGNQLTRLIDDILDLSKVESRRLTLEHLSFPLIEALTDIVSSLKGKAREKGIDLVLTAEGALPDRIVSDPTRLRQILLNIVGNAVKFTAHGGVYVTVSHASNRLTLSVRDTGVGIDPEGAARLFQPFAQADTSTARRFGGTGLGLLLARNLARELGGDVVLERSVVGEGTQFSITLTTNNRVPAAALGLCATTVVTARPKAATPVLSPEVSTSQIAAQPVSSHSIGIHRGATQPAAPASPKVMWPEPDAASAPVINGKAAVISGATSKPTGGRLSGTDVLVVEDAPDIRALLSLMLQSCGARVDLAADGVEGVAKARARDYDVVLMDLQLPQLDGFAATKALRDDGYRGPIVALSAFAMQTERARAIAAGCNAHLCKPIDKERLFKVVKDFSGVKAPLA